MDEWNRMMSHALRIMACLSLSFGLSSAGEAKSIIEPSRHETAATDVTNDISLNMDFVGFIMDGVGVLSESDGLAVTGTIRQLGELFPMSAGSLSLYGEFLTSELSGTQGDRAVSAAINSFGAERDAPILEFALAPATPNPSSGDVRFAWAVPRASLVRIAVLDVQGRQVTVLADGEHAPGRYEAVWSPFRSRQNAPGIYFVRMQTPERAFVRRIVVIP